MKNQADLLLKSKVAGIAEDIVISETGDLAESLRDVVAGSSSVSYEMLVKTDEVLYVSVSLEAAGSVRFWNSSTLDEFVLQFPGDGFWYWEDGIGVGNPMGSVDFDTVDITNSSSEEAQFHVYVLTDEGFTPTLPPTPFVVDLGYTPSPTNGIVTNTAGTDATIPLADGTNAGLIVPVTNGSYLVGSGGSWVDTTSFIGSDAQIGTASNNTTIETDGTIVCKGDATAWVDLSEAIIGSRLDTSSGRLDYDVFNAGVKFQSNARYPDEPIVVPIQGLHQMVIGTGAVARMHFHWLQQQSAVPNILLGYKITNYGTATTFETDWSNYTFLTPSGNAFTYPGGTFAQITKFPEIDISSMTISGSLDIVIFRDSNNTSGEFSGSDPVAGDVTIKYNDAHVPINMFGSREEFVK